MCTDVDRNDKSRVCDPGSVKLIGRRLIESYAGVFHTVDHVEGTLDRSALAIVTSPVVFAGRVLAGAPAPPAYDFGVLAGWLRTRGGLELVEAPPLARRVGDEAALRVLEALERIEQAKKTLEALQK